MNEAIAKALSAACAQVARSIRLNCCYVVLLWLGKSVQNVRIQSQHYAT